MRASKYVECGAILALCVALALTYAAVHRPRNEEPVIHRVKTFAVPPYKDVTELLQDKPRDTCAFAYTPCMELSSAAAKAKALQDKADEWHREAALRELARLMIERNKK